MNDAHDDGLIRKAIGVLGALIMAVLGSAGLGFLLSPLVQKRDEGWVDVGPADAFKPGTPVQIQFVERTRDSWSVTEKRSSAWVLALDNGQITVFDPRCPHLGCPFRWNILDKRFQCPCHTAAFAADGAVISGPSPRALDRFESKIEDNRLLILPRPTQGHS
ncbi:MAG: Rieske (2Fe-2S) protein [Elusimicrobia bacterium]|nr:Rieske (2Fe-2S) protein [Elusimicrobiota bacterium]